MDQHAFVVAQVAEFVRVDLAFLEEGVHVAPFGLELLGHGHANDFVPVDGAASDPQACALRIEISSERSLVLPFDEFAWAELVSDGREQQLKLIFAAHEVLVRGHSLRRIETAMQRMELSLLRKVPKEYRSVVEPGQA